LIWLFFKLNFLKSNKKILQLEQLSSEDLINIVRKQLAEKNAIKKAAEEAVKQAEVFFLLT
jgi:replication-associated recombination protein RarA